VVGDLEDDTILGARGRKLYGLVSVEQLFILDFDNE